ncbi:MAG: PCRF domain-containing protein [Phycisphaerales bacterium]|nr:MAG: PCRF domain-containing protein [Phycisphaerales bacterium]
MAALIAENLLRKLDELDRQFEQLGRQLADPAVVTDHRKVRALSVKRAAIEPIVSDYRAFRRSREQIEDLRSVIEANEDAELVELAREELPGLQEEARVLIDGIQQRLVTADDQAIGSIILEVRAGVGGDEAGIWAGDLLTMYRRFAAEKRWTIEEIELAGSEMGGFKSAIINISGEGVWANLGYEGGTHQVKRVPVTEAQGRIHTSTATVAVLPEPEEIEIRLDPNDVKEMITTSQGPGGQNVNKVATAVHLIHGPSGIEVRMQDTKSQAQNREKAWQLLRARLYEMQKAESEAERAENRHSMIGSGSRAEKIRTYRYKENIVVDHRLGSSGGTFNLTEVMAGHLQVLIDRLIEQDTAQRLAAL